MFARQLLFILLTLLSVYHIQSNSLKPSNEYLLLDQSATVSQTYKTIEYEEIPSNRANTTNDFLIGYNHPDSVLDAT